jgi:hypothetical protein
MSTPAACLTTAIRARLVSSPDVTALVPSKNILDAHKWPSPSPSIVIGETETAIEGALDLSRSVVHATVHVWEKGRSLERVTAIAGAVTRCINARLLGPAGGTFIRSSAPDQTGCGCCATRAASGARRSVGHRDH